MKSISEQLLELSEADPSRIFAKIWPPDESTVVTLSYRELVDGAKQVAGVIRQTIDGTQNVVIVMLPTSAELLQAFLGGILSHNLPSIFPVSASRVNIDLLIKSLTRTIEIARPAAIITTEDIKQKFFLDDDIAVRVVTPEDWRQMPPELKVPMPDPADMAFLQHSSGTTGLKKGVAISHGALVKQIASYSKSIDLKSSDKIACWLPLYHDMGLITGLFLPLLTKTPVLLMDPFEWVVNPVSFLRVISDEQATLCWLPNFSYLFMAEKIPDSRLVDISLTSLRALVNCSEPITAEAHQRFLQRFSRFGLERGALATCYAMAENTFAVTQSQLDRPPSVEIADLKIFQETGHIIPAREGAKTRTFVSSGTPINGVSVKLVDEHRVDVSERQIGEIAITSNCMLTEYFRRPELTAEAIHDGWYFTGDYGFRVGEELFVTGRKSDKIILSGKNIYPQDVEEIVSAFPGIRSGRTVAFGVFDEESGTEELVVLAEGEDVDGAPPVNLRRDIERAVAQRMECTISHLRVLPAGTLVKSTSGKISRSGCRNLWLDELSGSVESAHATQPATVEALAVKGFERAFTLALGLEILIQIASFLAPAILIRSTIDNTVLLTLTLVSSFYLYSFGVLVFSGLLMKAVPKPKEGLIKGDQDAFRWALLATLARFNRRTPAHWMAWIFPFPGYWFYRLCGAQMHSAVRLGSSEVLITDPYFLKIGEGTIVGHGALLSGHYVRDAKTIQLGQVTIGRNVLIGSGATVWPNVEIGDDAIVQERAAVMPGTIIPPGQVWGGSPAKSIFSQVRRGGDGQGSTAAATASENRPCPTEDDVRADVMRFMQRFDSAPLSEADLAEPVVDSGVISSLHFVELIAELEERYAVQLLDEKLSIRNLSVEQLIRRVVDSG